MAAIRVRDTLQAYRSRLDEALPGRVRRVVLYGTWARGEPKGAAPVNVFVLLSDATPDERFHVEDIGRGLFSEQKLTLDPVVLTVPQWNELERRQGHFVREVARGVDVGASPTTTVDQRLDVGEARRNTA